MRRDKCGEMKLRLHAFALDGLPAYGPEVRRLGRHHYSGFDTGSR